MYNHKKECRSILKIAAGLSLTAAAAYLVGFLFPHLSLSPADALIPALSFLSSGGEAASLAAGQYNIIFILVDQERYLGPSYPSDASFKARERLKTLGTSFEKHYICSSMSTSSRSVIYTGKHITQTKLYDNVDMPYISRLDEDLATIGDMMREVGYYTAYRGKWHMAGGGTMTEGDDATVADRFRTKSWLEPYGFADWNIDGDTPGGIEEGYSTDDSIAGEAISWLRSKGTSLNKDGKPFFFAVNLINPHDVMYFNTDAEGESAQSDSYHYLEIKRAPKHAVFEKTYPNFPIPSTHGQDISDGSDRLQAHKEYYKRWSANIGVIPDQQANWERMRDFYFNCIQDSDDKLGLILDELEANGMLEKTIIVMTSDHGEMQGAHHLSGKGNNMYEENIHVPMIVYHPERAGGVVNNNALTSHLDLAPTFLHMSASSRAESVIAKNGLRGHDLLPLVGTTDAGERGSALFACSLLSVLDSDVTSYQEPPLSSDKRGIVRGVVTSDGYKFARYFKPEGFNTPYDIESLYSNNDVEIYDMNGDPEELDNLAGKLRSENPELVLSLNAKLNEAIAKEIGTDNGGEFKEKSRRDGGSSGCSAAPWPFALLVAPAALLARAKRRR